MAKNKAETGDQQEPAVEIPQGPFRWSCVVPSLGGQPLITEADTKEEAEVWFRSQISGLDPNAVVSIDQL
jgi:hypothetical protein